MLKPLALFCSIGLLLTGCLGRGSQVKVMLDSDETLRYRVALFGDSTTAPRAGVNIYENQLRSRSVEEGMNLEVKNFGISGSHTGRRKDNKHHKIPHALDRLESEVLAWLPDLVTVQFGINDCWVDSDDPLGASRIPIDLYEQNLIKIVSLIRGADAKPVFMTPNPVEMEGEPWRNEKLTEYIGVMKRVAAEFEVDLIDINDAWPSTAEGRLAMLPDGMHPDSAGHSIVARNLAGYIKKEFYSGRQPVFQDLFINGEKGYALYRIPSVVNAGGGHIVAFTEGRGIATTDCAENDLVCRVSNDGGKSWGEMILIAEAGAASLNNPTTVYLEEEDRILMVFQSYPPKLYEANTGKGTSGDNICRNWMVYSDDKGQSWSEPKDITASTKKEWMSAVAAGPGAAIELKKGPYEGRILVPFQSSGMDAGWFNFFIYSDDRGVSWQMSDTFSGYGTNENQMVQLDETTLMVNARNHRFTGTGEKKPGGWNPWLPARTSPWRGIYKVTMTESGFKWSEMKEDKELPDPRCQGALLVPEGEWSRSLDSPMLFSNPANTLLERSINPHPLRINGKLRLSADGGENWKWSKRIYGGRFTEFRYSVLAETPSGIGMVFETVEGIRYADIDVKWLTSGDL